MPAVLAREDLARWLDPALEDPARLAPLLRPLPAAALVPTPVSARVNRVANDDPALIAAETPAQSIRAGE